MFTGIVEEIGRVIGIAGDGGSARLEVACSVVLEGTSAGDSVSVNGCCLTVTGVGEGGFTADLMGETLDRTALGALTAGSPVNLERALRADARLGGHLVQGHVDGVAEVVAVEAEEGWTTMRITLPAALSSYLVEKGSITVDGTSLTVVSLDGGSFTVGLIPHTLSATTLGRRRAGDRVNLEADVIAKYVERMLRSDVATPYRKESR